MRKWVKKMSEKDKSEKWLIKRVVNELLLLDKL